MSSNLLRDRRFWPLFWTQFLGAFNDNVFKNALVVLITYRAVSISNIPSKQIVVLCSGVFILPFFLFSATAGQLADKYSKSRLVVWIKIWEVAVMVVAAIGFITEQFGVLIATLFMMGLQSTFFGPVKYSILPQLLRQDELVSGNGYVEMGTFISILLGTILGGTLISWSGSGEALVGAAVLVTALLGWLSSLRIKFLAPVAPDLTIKTNPVTPTLEILRRATRVRSIFLSILGISWFWFLGTAILSLLPIYCNEFLRGNTSLMTFFLALFSVGVGLGSLLCGRLSAGKLELGLVPVGSIGLSFFALDLFLVGRPNSLLAFSQGHLSIAQFLSSAGSWRIAMDLLLLAVFGGLFIVPLYTLIQQRSSEEERSRIIAANNILNALFMVVAAVLLALAFALDLTIPQIFLLLSLMNLVVAVYIYTVIPEFMFRFICWVIANVMYRLNVVGSRHIPQEGPAVLVCNHVSFIDWLVIASACPRPVRFVMHYSFLNMPFTGRIFRDAKVIPIAGTYENPKVLESAFRRIAEELNAGEVVCIFPEGKITQDGKLNPFRPGVEWIVGKTPVPVIPMALNGLWGSFFSRKDGRPMRKPFRRFWSRISLVIGEPVRPQDATAQRLQGLVSSLMSGSQI